MTVVVYCTVIILVLGKILKWVDLKFGSQVSNLKLHKFNLAEKFLCSVIFFKDLNQVEGKPLETLILIQIQLALSKTSNYQTQNQAKTQLEATKAK